MSERPSSPKQPPKQPTPRFDVVARVVESKTFDAVLSRASRALASGREHTAPFPAAPPFAATPPPAGTAHDRDALALMQQIEADDDQRFTNSRGPTVAAFARAYRKHSASPVDVADAVLAGIAASESGAAPMRFFISVNADDVRAQAEASAQRHAQGRALSALDGVPVAVKDEIDQSGHRTTLGTRMSSMEPARSDCVAVARLRALGAVLVGKANMHELGAGPTGLNHAFGTCRNPWDPLRFPGGSSSGSAAAVAAGLVPLAVGCDGGGSIRIPASLCGVVGLKPTYGRVPQRGETPPIAYSVTNIGPIGRSVADVAAGYAALAGPDEIDGMSHGLPPVTLAGWDAPDLRGVTLGIVSEWWRDADVDVVKACERNIASLEARGARVRDVQLETLRDVTLGLMASIGVEVKGNAWMNDLEQRRVLAVDTRVALTFARHLGRSLYERGQRSRARVADAVRAVLQEVDLLVSPTTTVTAPLIPLQQGIGDLRQTIALMRTTALANVTGQPAISYPVGFDRRGMPVGLQLVARPFEEALLLRVARIGEEAVASSSSSSRAPRRWATLPS
ncbi:MAG: amidase [Deltaproteobacteria bacterium]|nr:amidase [Deltaproteobacteria bacterium]